MRIHKIQMFEVIIIIYPTSMQCFLISWKYIQINQEILVGSSYLIILSSIDYRVNTCMVMAVASQMPTDPV